MKIFVAGAHTDVGKTWFSCALIRTAIRQGLSVSAFKPVVSGLDPEDHAGSDPGRLLAALGRPGEDIATISPWRFAAPLAPPMAAALEGQTLPLAPMVEACRDALAEPVDLALVEGVGGLMSPIADDGLGLDLMMALAAPSFLVTGSYLGAISHALTALEVMRARGLPVAAVVASESGGPDHPDFIETVAAIARFAADTPVLAMARGSEDASEALAILWAKP
ncbi:dethiobiotin synthase [Phenylobacterium immobile]|uniref:dethiobiotin synthase n=1 Tax=Phenylobacterium immobile TaxID=21 RepID=UPI000B84C1B8|nr:dethiobiotin synthase [Phenylobacterium immobile]